MGELESVERAGPASERTRVRRGAPRARYERDEVLAILDAGLIAHVGVTTPDGPLVLPMVYGRDGERLYLHGAAANHLLGTGEGEEICVTVTHLDGLVMARTPFPNSMNYRSVVVRGRPRASTTRSASATPSSASPTTSWRTGTPRGDPRRST